jgi:predicted HNH restriction endonuclease
MLSRERNQALKLANRSCANCGVKASQAKGREQKIEVHHTKGINWEELIDLVYERLLQTPEDYTCLCPDCHLQLHEHEKKK